MTPASKLAGRGRLEDGRYVNVYTVARVGASCLKCAQPFMPGDEYTRASTGRMTTKPMCTMCRPVRLV